MYSSSENNGLMVGHWLSGFSSREQNSVIENRPSPDATKQSQTTTLPPPCSTSGMTFFMKCYVRYIPDITWCKPSKRVNLCLVSPQNICPKLLGIIRMCLFFGKCLFLIYESWTLTLTGKSEAYSSLMLLWVNFFLLDEPSMRSWSNCGQTTTAGRVH